MDSSEQQFRSQMIKAINLCVSSQSQLSESKWMQLLVRRLRRHTFDAATAYKIESRLKRIDRYLSAEELGSAKKELLSIVAVLSDDSANLD